MRVFSLIIPVFNEEKTLKDIISEVLTIENDIFFKNNNISLELVLIDDFSSDNSYNILKSFESPKMKVLKHSKNLGKGAAIKTGLMAATGDFIGIQDADMEYNPKEYIKLLKTMIENNADVVYGSRYLANDNKRVLNFWHTLMNKGLTLFSNMYTNLTLTDMETCYKLFKKDVIKKIAPKLKENRFGFEPEVTSYIAQEKCKIYECAISYNPRSYDEGKKIKAKDGFRALYCIMHYGKSSISLPFQFILYTLIGGICAIANILLFLFLTKIIDNLLINISISFVFSALLNYILCIIFLFKHNAHFKTFGEILAYIITLIIMGSVDYICTLAFLNLEMNNLLSKSLSNIVGLFGNFLLRKYFVFFEKKLWYTF